MRHLLKYIICVVVALLCCISAFAQEDNIVQKSAGGCGGAVAFTPPEPIWSLKSETDDLLIGDTAYITLKMEQVPHPYAFEGELTYEPENLRFESARFPDGGISKAEAVDGVIMFVYSCVGESELNELENSVIFQFTCLTEHDSVVTLTAASAVNINLVTESEKNLSIIAPVKMKKPDPPKRPSGSGGSSGSFRGGTVRPQPSTSPNALTKPETSVAPETGDENISMTVPYFQDLQGFSWAEEAIVALSARNILLGTGGGNFEPARPMTRAEAAKMLLAAFPFEDKIKEEINFSDVENGAWYTEYIRSAAACGWLSGYENGSFCPEEQITREDFSVILMRISQVQALLPVQSKRSFTDFAEISTYAIDSVTALAARGVIQGDQNGAFAPQSPVTRAEAAKILYSILNLCEEGNAE